MPVIGNQVTVSLDSLMFATDFSQSSSTARLYAEALAHRYHSKVRLLHVVDLNSGFESPDVGLNLNVFRRFGEESLAHLCGELAAKHLRVETQMCEGTNPAAEILQVAGDKSVDLLVIGTRGHKGLARLVLGSTAEALIHQASCPVLTIGPAVSPPEGPVNFQRIVYATDFSAESANACVFALSFAQDFCAHLYLCHVSPPFNSVDGLSDEALNDRFIHALERLVPDVAKEYCEPECVLEQGVAADGILLLAKRVKADLIVLGARRTSHWYDDLKTGVAFQVISASSCPVLTLRQ